MSHVPSVLFRWCPFYCSFSMLMPQISILSGPHLLLDRSYHVTPRIRLQHLPSNLLNLFSVALFVFHYFVADRFRRIKRTGSQNASLFHTGCYLKPVKAHSFMPFSASKYSGYICLRLCLCPF